jgi:hypothetical protein
VTDLQREPSNIQLKKYHLEDDERGGRTIVVVLENSMEQSP